MKDPYSILGVSKDATDEEVKAAYHDLARKYHPDNYDESNPLKDLAKEKMQEVNEAYDRICDERKKKKKSGGEKTESSHGGDGLYYRVRTLINDRNFKAAEVELSGVPVADRTAEWHYLASVLLMHRNRVNDAMRELEIACTMDPGNEEYQRAKEMFNNTAGGYSGAYYSGAGYSNSHGRRSSADDACNCCTNLVCLDCLCECLGGDLIRCI